MNKLGTLLTTNPKIQLVFRLILGITFLYASFHKIMNPGPFAEIIYGYGLLPGNLINILAIFLPFFEFICALSLVLGIYKGGASMIINLMLMGFIIAISINLIRGYEFDCGCFASNAPDQGANAIKLLLRDAVLLGVGFMIFLSDTRKQSS